MSYRTVPEQRGILPPSLPERTCPHCGYVWTPRKSEPKVCPYCHTRLDKKSSGGTNQ